MAAPGAAPWPPPDAAAAIDDYLCWLDQLLRTAAEMLFADSGDAAELEQPLLHWATAFAVLARETLAGVVLLLRADRRRAAHMLARPLVDYDFRLRYYYVRSIKLLRCRQKQPNVPIQHLLDQSEAAKDWAGKDISAAWALRGTDRSFWPADAREALDAVMNRLDERTQRNFANLTRWLAEHEARERGVLANVARDLESDYRNLTANWAFQSAFLHGDQAIVSDVVLVSDDATRLFHESPAANPRSEQDVNDPAASADDLFGVGAVRSEPR